MQAQADFHIAQSAHYAGNDRWTWSCWIDADPAHLADIAAVTWILHPTFARSRVTVTTRDNGFRLDSGGWGTFTVRARLALADGGTRELRHMLKLSYPDTDAAPSSAEPGSASLERPLDARARGRKVFLSYSSENGQIAQAINRYIAETGASVLSANEVDAGQPIEAAVQKMIRESDAFVSIQSDDYTGHWAMLENKIAQAEGKPMLSVPVGSGNAAADDMQLQVARFVNNLAF